MKRIQIITGHYGSGKTNLAILLGRKLQGQGKNVAIVDLDIVNPYFRLSDRKKKLEQGGFQIICSPYASSNLDIPALPKEIYGAIGDRETCLVIDVGGDDRGAVALGRYEQQLKEQDDYEMVFVVNFYRPLTRNAEAAYEVMQEIEAASHLKCTCIVDNTNLGAETPAEEEQKYKDETQKLARLSGLRIDDLRMDKVDIEENYGESNI